MATLTVYPDADAESTSFDGYVLDDNATWATAQGSSTADGNDDSDTTLVLGARHNGSLYRISRAIVLFDTSFIASSNATVDAATLSLWFTTKNDGDNDAQAYFSIVSSTPASNTGISNNDYDQVGDSIDNPTKNSDDVDITDITTGQYTNFTLNATGLGNVSKTGVSKFGVREGHDMEDVAVASSTDNLCICSSADHTGTSQDPKLVVTYTSDIPLFDATAESSNSSASSLTYALTITDNGGDEGLIVSTNSRDNFTGTQTVTYNSVSMTEYTGSSDTARLWYLASPSTGSSHNVVATFNGTGQCASIAAAYSGCNTGDLIGATQTASGSGTAVSLSITTDTDNSLVVDTMTIGAGSATLTPGAGQRQKGTDISPGGNFTAGLSEEDVPTAGATTMSWTSGTSQSWAISAVEVHGASAEPSPNVNDTITITESVSITLINDVNVNDTISITESVTMMVDMNISVNDLITITESVTMMVDMNISVNDTVSITEDVSALITLDFGFSVNDAISITESVTVLITELFIDVSDTITITEAVTMLLGIAIDVNDTITLTEDITTTFVVFIDVSDTVSVSENIEMALENFLSVNDSITITESVTLLVPDPRTGFVKLRSKQQEYPLGMNDDRII